MILRFKCRGRNKNCVAKNATGFKNYSETDE